MSTAVPRLNIPNIGGSEGLHRVNLKAGESKTVQLSMKAEALAWWNQQQNHWEVESGAVRILIGSSSAAIRFNKTITIE